MCSQTPAAAQRSAIAGTGSTEVVEVVPTVATTATASERSSTSARMRNSASDGDLAHLEPEQPARLVDRRVRVLGAVDDVPALGRDVARGRERGERRGGRAVLDVAVPGRRQAEQVGEPGERDLLELGRGRRRAPEHRVLVERRDQELGEDARLGRGDAEVREEARVVPVRDARQQDRVEVGEHRRERLALSGRRRRQLCADRRPGATRESTGSSRRSSR